MRTIRGFFSFLQQRFLLEEYLGSRKNTAGICEYVRKDINIKWIR